MKEIIVSKNEAGQRLDRILGKLLPQAPKGFVYKMLRKKNITLNEKKAGGEERPGEGDRIQLWLSFETLERFGIPSSPERIRTNPMDLGIAIVYEDPHTLIVNKPSGVLSQKASAGDVSVNDWLLSYLSSQTAKGSFQGEIFKPSICNRLDRNTSGLLVCGKSLPGLRMNGALIRERGIKKEYLAIAAGVMERKLETAAWLKKDEQRNRVRVEHKAFPGGEEIRTNYFPLFSDGKNTVVQVELITGKSHQIRAHLSFLGFPVVGDGKYGNARINQWAREAFQVKSQLLHCFRLTYPRDFLLEERDQESFSLVQGQQFVCLPDKKFQRVVKTDYGNLAYQRA